MAITEQRNLPPEFIEALGKTYAADLTRQAGIPSITTATTQQPGETADQFAQRQAQAQQFGITKAGMAELAPQVAAQDPLQAAAYAQAVDPTTGLGAYQPFLTKAGTAADAAAGLTGPMTTAQTTAYMSPYQQQVIDTTLTEFDRQAQIRANQQAAATLGIQVHLVVVVKVYKEQSINQQVTGIERLYNLIYYNKVSNKHNLQDNKTLLIIWVYLIYKEG